MNKTVFIGLVIMPALAVLPSAQAQTYHSLQPMAGFGTYGNGEMLADGSVPFLTTGAVQRGLCRNPLTGNLIFVDRAVSGQSGSVSGAIYVLDGATGAVLNTLSTNGIDGGSFADYAVAVGPDGVIYVDNVIADSNSGPFKIYRWASEAGQDDPTVAFSGALGTNNLRWGNSMDVRGTGAGTQILVSSGGAEAALFTTSDGVNFAATDLFMDVTGTLQGSVGFGLGNTFWAKWAGLDLRLLSFDAGAQTATTIRDFGGTDMPEMAAPEIAGIDTSNNLLAVVSYHSTNPDEVLLYSIANLDDLPQLLDAYTLSDINNANSGSPRGYLAIGGGKLYAHNLNNGIFAFNLLSDALPAPAILTQPLSMSLLAGGTAKFRVGAQRGFGFQWSKGDQRLPGATNSVLVITNVQASDVANYSVVVSNATGTITSSNAQLTVLAPEDTYHLSEIWSAAPGTQPYFITTGGSGSTPNQRSLAYNSFSNHLYVISRGGSSTANFNVNVIDPDTGALLYTLNTNGANFSGFAGQIGLVGIGVSGDGSIYACCVDTATPNVWRLYRWADGGSNTIPEMVFAGDPLNSGANFRWGDTLAVRGSGMDTEVMIDIQGTATPYMAILTPSDPSLDTFTSSYWFLENTSGSTVGRTLQFGVGDTLWQRRKGTPLVLSSFSSDNPIAPIVANYTSLPTTVGLVAVDQTRNILGAIDFSGATGSSPDKIELYEISDLNHPALLSSLSFPINKAGNTGNIGQVIFGGDKMFALESQNGLVGMRVELGVTAPPALTLTPGPGVVVLTWQGNGFTLESASNLTNPLWETLSYDPGETNTATDSISGNARFYRLRK